MEDRIAAGVRRLRASGRRITPQRKMVLNILAEASSHLTAQDVHERAKYDDACLSLATVYRTLNILKETGVVHELHLDGEHHHYELSAKQEHSHLVCLGCGRVIEVDSAAFCQAAKAAGEAHGFVVATAQVELAGYCEACYRRQAEASARAP
jgi:Fur family transcriptional regulator, ferric uptake regulator